MPELPFPDPPLDDGVVRLRRWRPEDTRQRYEGFSDELCQRCSSPRTEPTTEDDVVAAYERRSQRVKLGAPAERRNLRFGDAR